MTVVTAADHRQLATALRATWDLPGPVYYRLGKDDTTTVPGLEVRFALRRVERLREGADEVLVAMGSIAAAAAAAAAALATRGIRAGLVVVGCVQPPPSEDLAAVLERTPLALTVEAHYAVGGVGSLVSEVVAEHGLACRVVRCGVRATPDGLCGSQHWLHRAHGLSRETLVETALAALGRR
jgi:transketolase